MIFVWRAWKKDRKKPPNKLFKCCISRKTVPHLRYEKLGLSVVAQPWLCELDAVVGGFILQNSTIWLQLDILFLIMELKGFSKAFIFNNRPNNPNSRSSPWFFHRTNRQLVIKCQTIISKVKNQCSDLHLFLVISPVWKWSSIFKLNARHVNETVGQNWRVGELWSFYVGS